MGRSINVEPRELRVEAGPAVAEDVPDIYEQAEEDVSNDLEVLILDHPSMDAIGRILDLRRT